MRKWLLPALAAGVTLTLISVFFGPLLFKGEKEELESLKEHFDLEFKQIRDPHTGTIPTDRLVAANQFTRYSQQLSKTAGTAALTWQERGPIYDSLGPSNTNYRGNQQSYTAGIVQTHFVDLAGDATGNTVFVGSPSGGLWKCTNFLGGVPNWTAVNDFQANLAIASICQDPSNPNNMYIATGDANTRDVRGYGIWKSTDHGVTWNVLQSTISPSVFNFAFKIACDDAGNVYLATGGGGLKRSNDGGTTWTSISPDNMVASNSTYVTDIEFSKNGRLHAAFGYGGTKCQHFYTDVAATVSSSSGWNFSTGLRNSNTACTRIEMAASGNTLYAVTANSSNNIDSCYKSVDGGATWVKRNTIAYTSGLGSSQTWYAVTLAINPDDSTQFIVGGLDAYKSSNSGSSISRLTYWVTNSSSSTSPYVHADHHAISWYKVNGGSRIAIGCDGGIFASVDGGTSWQDRNRNLAIRQFFSCDIHPAAGSNYMIAGAQDNGNNQLKNAGLSYGFEVVGGDGSFVYINKQNPQIQFTSYLYNDYHVSTDGGNTWNDATLSSSQGLWTNPFDYDDANDIMYASNSNSIANSIRRWPNASTGATSSNTLTVSALNRSGTVGSPSAFKMSPYTPNRLFIASDNGAVVRLDNAKTVSSGTIASNSTTLTGASFPTSANINCINTGTNDSVLIVCFSNYGVQNLWYSTNAGTSWTAIDGNLPDMPVWWAVFEPGRNDRMVIATEAGIYSTSNINGASTVWTADPGFPVVRTTMLKVRPSDSTIVASTWGRGLWTSKFQATCSAASIVAPPTAQTTCAGSSASFSVSATGTGLSYQWMKDGFPITGATSSVYNIPSATVNDSGLYTVVVTGSCGTATSNGAQLTVNTGGACSATAVSSISAELTEIELLPNLVHSNSRLRVKAAMSMKIEWIVLDAQGRIVKRFMQQVTSGQNELPFDSGALTRGSYQLVGNTNKGHLAVLKFVKM